MKTTGNVEVEMQLDTQSSKANRLGQAAGAGEERG
jgi:hypothetical protein